MVPLFTVSTYEVRWHLWTGRSAGAERSGLNIAVPSLWTVHRNSGDSGRRNAVDRRNPAELRAAPQRLADIRAVGPETHRAELRNYEHPPIVIETATG